MAWACVPLPDGSPGDLATDLPQAVGLQRLAAWLRTHFGCGAVDDCQRQTLLAALAAHQGNWAQAARQLEVDASNLHKLARRLRLEQ